jgi:hypothetical protein
MPTAALGFTRWADGAFGVVIDEAERDGTRRLTQCHDV